MNTLNGVVEAASAAAEKARLACVRCVNKAKKTFGEAYEVSSRATAARAGRNTRYRRSLLGRRIDGGWRTRTKRRCDRRRSAFLRSWSRKM